MPTPGVSGQEGAVGLTPVRRGAPGHQGVSGLHPLRCSVSHDSRGHVVFCYHPHYDAVIAWIPRGPSAN
jgi:hypothetical protein